MTVKQSDFSTLFPVSPDAAEWYTPGVYEASGVPAELWPKFKIRAMKNGEKLRLKRIQNDARSKSRIPDSVLENLPTGKSDISEFSKKERRALLEYSSIIADAVDVEGIAEILGACIIGCENLTDGTGNKIEYKDGSELLSVIAEKAQEEILNRVRVISGTLEAEKRGL